MMLSHKICITIITLCAMIVVSLGVYYIIPLKVTDEAQNFAAKKIEFMNGTTSNQAMHYLCSDGENGYYFIRDNEKPKIIKVSDNKTINELDCEKMQGDADKMWVYSAYITNGELYFTVSLFYGYEETNEIYKTDINLSSYEFIAKNYKLGNITSHRFVVESGIIYYTLQSGEKYKIASRYGNEEKIIYESDNEIEPLMIKDNCIFIRECYKEKLYRINLETKKVKKLPFGTIQISDIKFSNITDIDFVDENKRIMAVYMKSHESSYDLEGENVIYFFDVKTGKKHKLKTTM